MKSWIAFLFGSSLLILGTTQTQAAVTLATPEQDRYAKQAVPPPGKALIYVYRLDDASPQAAPGLWLNKRDSGHLEPRTYGMWAAGPGRLEVRAGRVDATPLTISCEAGRIYFVQLAVNADGSMNLRQVPYGTGRTEMRAARLVLDPAIAARAVAATPKPAAPVPTPAPAPEKKAPAMKAAPVARKAQEPRDRPVEEDTSEARSGVTLIFKGGSFSLGSDAQNINAVSGGVTTSFQTTFGGTASAFGLEAEWRARNGWAFGGEAMAHSHEFTTVPAVPLGTGEMRVVTVLVNAKKYFRPEAVVQPYLGAGIGIARVSMSGQLEGTTTGYSMQAMGGVAFRWERVGLYTEAKYQANNAPDVDASGIGLFAGMSVHF
jgi:opacity protein-like surface antigen